MRGEGEGEDEDEGEDEGEDEDEDDLAGCDEHAARVQRNADDVIVVPLVVRLRAVAPLHDGQPCRTVEYPLVGEGKDVG